MKKLLKVVLVAGAAVMVGCADSKDTSGPMVCVPAKDLGGIVNGYKVTPENSLSKKVVFLMMDSGVCTGTPITSTVILTAAHCVRDAKTVLAAFRTDVSCESGFNVREHAIVASSWYSHHKYSGKADARYDVALVKLSSPIPSDYHISRIYDGRSPLSSDKVTLAGYGSTRYAENEMAGSGFLRTTTKSFRNEVRQQGMNIHVLQPDSGVCSGDSGGPMFVEVNGRKQIIGINAIVRGPEGYSCSGTATAMYAPVFIDWIRERIPHLR